MIIDAAGGEGRDSHPRRSARGRMVRAVVATAIACLTAAPVRAARPPVVAPPPPPLAAVGEPAADAFGATPVLIPLDSVQLPSSAAPPPIRTETLPLDGMMDRDVVGIDGSDIGHVIDVLVDATGEPRAVLVETGGFLGVGDRRIAVAWSALSFAPRAAPRPVVADLSVDQVRAAPAYQPGKGIVAVGPLAPAPAPGPAPVSPSPPALLPQDAATPAGDGIAPYPAPLAAPRGTTRR